MTKTRQAPASADASTLPLPHDRDERAVSPVEDDQQRKNRAPIEQARKDVEAGLQDTERIGIPNDVPPSGRNAGRKG